mmetsp:Transcript_29251/g.32845  ORF Transcript_29251/g.32845 Transcript_29251/m.32845 type:complete len:895 (+) Transcript_29251:105-2789(+)
MKKDSRNQLHLAFLVRNRNRKWQGPLINCVFIMFLSRVPSFYSFLRIQRKYCRLETTLSVRHNRESFVGKNKKLSTSKISQKRSNRRTTSWKKNLSSEAVKLNQELSRILLEETYDRTVKLSSRGNNKYYVSEKAVEKAENLLLQKVEQNMTRDNYDTFSFNLVLSAWARQRSLEGARRADILLQILLKTSDDYPNIRADSYSYSNVLNAYAKSGGKRRAALRAEELLHQMEVRMKITTDVCHNAVMDCWSLSGDDDAGRRANIILTKLEENKERNIKLISNTTRLPPPSRIAYNICMKAWARSKNGALHAHKLLNRMQTSDDEDLHPDKISFSTCIDAYCRSTSNLTANTEKAEKLLYQMEQASPKNPSIRPDVVTYTSVLYSYAKAGIDIDRAMSLINRMKKYACEEPNTTFLNTLLYLFSKQGKNDHAEALLKSMKQNDLADKISYTSVIATHANNGNATRALALFRELEDLYKSSSSNRFNADRYLPTEKTFISLIHAISKSKESSKTSLDEIDNLVERMQSLYNETKHPELLLTTATYSTIFFLLSKIKDIRAPTRATEMINEMKIQQNEGNLNVRPDATTYAYLINIFTKARVPEAAIVATKYLNEVEDGYAAGDDNLRPTKLLYSAVLQAYAKSASREGANLAEELLQRTKDLYKQGKIYAKPTTLYYNAVMDGLARSKQGKAAAFRAEKLLDELETRGRAGDPELSPTSRSYNAVILAWKISNCTDAPNRSEAILKRMNERYGAGDKGCRPDQVTMNSIIGVWANSRQTGAAERAETYLKFMEQLYFEAEDKSLKPDIISYNSVIDAYAWCSSEKGAHRAEEVYNRMQKNFLATGDDDLRPNIFTLTTLTNVWIRNGDNKSEVKLKYLRHLMSETRKQHQAKDMVI